MNSGKAQMTLAAREAQTNSFFITKVHRHWTPPFEWPLAVNGRVRSRHAGSPHAHI
jgi:hypothetical protein